MDSESNRARRAQKEALEVRIAQQRIQLTLEARRWYAATRKVDQAWHAVMRWKVPLYTVGGLLLLAAVRKPGALQRWTRRGMAGAFLVQRVRRVASFFR